jgi:hypothetical protein
MRPCQLYRQYAADGTLLYVGIAYNAMIRTGQHSKQPWAHHVARVEIVDFPSRERAAKAEKWAIESEQPVYNQRLRGRLKMSNMDVGKALGFTLADAYRMARKGDRLNTIDPIEFETMSRTDRRRHCRELNRLARLAPT